MNRAKAHHNNAIPYIRKRWDMSKELENACDFNYVRK